jgi:hypothetical protein
MASYWQRAMRNWGENLFGTETKKKGSANQQAGADIDKTIAGNAATLGHGYDTGAQESMGVNAGDMLSKADAASQTMSDATARQASWQAAKDSIKAARTAGMNKGMAGVQAGQQAGDVYGNTFANQMNSNKQLYNENAGMFGQQGQNMANRGLQAAGQLQGLGAQQQAQAQNTFNSTMGGIGKVAGAIAGGI